VLHGAGKQEKRWSLKGFDGKSRLRLFVSSKALKENCTWRSITTYIRNSHWRNWLVLDNFLNTHLWREDGVWMHLVVTTNFHLFMASEINCTGRRWIIGLILNFVETF
jgi:hypothetical protein